MYSRTQNENGTYNTRCLYCLEARHICPERALAELLAMEIAIESRKQAS
jgi:formate hydrogenlyase subunit 6/NADH:ubiquinone oxidoreductase subunit I